MDETQEWPTSIDGPGLSVELQPKIHAASLRYFQRDGAFAAMVQSVTGVNLPSDLGANLGTDATAQHITLLAWRSPTETTLLTTDAGLLDALQSAAAGFSDGCIVDQRGGLSVLRARGPAVPDLVAKTAGHGAMPAIGEARRSRFADVAVSILKVRGDEILLVIDRVYVPHVMASIRVSCADLAAPLFD